MNISDQFEFRLVSCFCHQKADTIIVFPEATSWQSHQEEPEEAQGAVLFIRLYNF